jgi:hypothetical protein
MKEKKMRFDEVDLGPSLLRVQNAARRNFLETLRSLIRDEIVDENDRVGEMIYKLEKMWDMEN